MKKRVKENQKGEKIKEMQEYKILKNNYKGITLIALVITIIVLLILASVSIAMLTGDNGILTRASDAKIETALGAVKEQIGLYQIEKKMDNKEVTPENLLAEGKVSRTVQLGEADKYYMYYALKENSFEGMQGLGKGNIASLKDVFLIDDNLNVKYIASNGKEYGDNLKNKVLEDETEIKFSSKAFSEYVSKISGVTEEEMKFKWMKNQTNLTITDPNVDSLQDLVFFPNLINLKLGTTEQNAPNITSMKGIENCNKLKYLEIWYGPNKDYSAVSSLQNLGNVVKRGGSDIENMVENIKKCNNLKSVDIANAKINNINRISELTTITSLNLSHCGLNNLEGIKEMIKLEYIAVSDNNITDIKGIENLKMLKGFSAYNNKISDITPLGENDKLMSLDLRGNKEIDGDRNNYTGKRLEYLNKIGEILDRGGTIYLDTSKLKLFTNYKKLDLSLQEIKTLEALEGMTQINHLNLQHNAITLEDEKSKEIIKNMKELKYLDLSYNKVTNVVEINELTNLRELLLAGEENKVDLKQIEDIISNLNKLTVSNESLKTITNCDVNKINRLNLQYAYVTELPDLSKFTKLSSLSLQGNTAIKNINIISQISSLESLNLSYCNMHNKMINFSNFNNLRSLNLSYNTLWTEDLENLKALRNNTNLTINLDNNSIIDATALLELNSNTKISLRNNINLSQESKDKLKAKFGSNVTF